MSRLYKEPWYVGLMQKHAGINLDEGSSNKWGQEIFDYIKNSFPFLNEGLSAVLFKSMNEKDGSAIAQIEYSPLKMTIPILVEKFKVNLPDIGLIDGKVYPLDQKYLERVIANKSVMGNEVENKRKDIGFINSLFTAIDADGLGDPMTDARGKFGSIERLKQAFDSFGVRSPVLQEMERKIAAYEPEEVEVVASVFSSGDTPYHYDGLTLEKRANEKPRLNRFRVGRMRNVNVTEKPKCKHKDYAVSSSTDDSFAFPDVQRIKGICTATDILTEHGLRDGMVIGRMFSSTNKVHRKERSLVLTPNKDGAVSWAYGEPFGVRKDTSELFLPLKDVSEEAPFSKWVVFGYMDRISVPYLCQAIQRIRMGEKGNIEVVLDMIDIDGAKSRLWLKDGIVKPIKISKDKLVKEGYGVIAGTDADVYLVPNYKILQLPDSKIELVDKMSVENAIKEKHENEYPIPVKFHRLSDDTYDLTVGDEKRNVTEKQASLFSQYYIGENVFIPEKTYRIKEAEHPQKIKVTGLQDVGYFLKVADFIDTYPQLRESLTAYGEKQASIEKLVNDVSGIEAIDEEMVANPEELVEDLKDIHSRIGKILLLSRLGKVEVSENVLGGAYKSLTTLINTISGTV